MNRPAGTSTLQPFDAEDLPSRLRSATDVAHRHLEQGLELLIPPLSHERFLVTLSRFWGFHAAWEPALRKRRELSGLMAERYRIDLLTRDLLALGLSQNTIDALPRCEAAAALCTSTARALGSLYVLEGSTLGGQLITRALLKAPWLPPSGLSYFDPYGLRTGAMWREIRAVLNASSSPAADPLVESGARATFAQLHAWLVD